MYPILCGIQQNINLVSAANQSVDADSSWAPGLIFDFQIDLNVQRGTL